MKKILSAVAAASILAVSVASTAYAGGLWTGKSQYSSRYNAWIYQCKDYYSDYYWWSTSSSCND